MTLSEHDLETRLRRTFAAVADVPLDDPMPEAATSRRRPVALLVAAAAVVATIVAAAVVVDSDERVSTVADGGEAAASTAGDYFPTKEESGVLFRAEQLLVRKCMEAAGQPYVEASPGQEQLEADWNRLGRTDAAFADRIGYVSPGGSSGGRNPAVDRLRTAEERDAWSLALTGQPYSGEGPSGPSVPIVHPVTGEEVGRQGTGGCFGQVERELYGDVARHSSLQMWIVNDVRNAVERQVVEDTRLAEGIRSWSSCMKERGHDYADPFGPVHEFNDARAAERPTARELAVARADVECKDVTGLVHVYRKLHAEHGRAVVAEHRRYFVEYRAIVDRALAGARAVLDRPASTTTTVVAPKPEPGGASGR